MNIKQRMNMDIQESFDELKNNFIYEKNGSWGMNTPEGNEVYAARFKYIGKCSDYVLFIDNDWHYLKIARGCKTSGFMQESSRPYISEGKVGFKKDDQVIIPAIYDFITPWFGSDVFRAVKDGREMYVDSNGKEVLTRVKRFGDKDTQSPFWLRSNSLGINTITKYVGHLDENNPNVITIGGSWVELDRTSKEEIMAMLVDESDDLPLTKENLSLMTNNFSYEYSLYQTHSSGEHPLRECYQQLKKMNAFDNSWHFVVKLWQAPGEYVKAEELRFFRSELAKHEQLGDLVMAVGHDATLASGEVKMLFITHYHERCWPASFEYEWSDNIQRYSICKLQEFVPWLKQQVDEVVMDEYKEEVYHDQLLDVISSLKYSSNFAWKEVEGALNFFKQEGAPVRNALPKFMKQAWLNAQKKNDVACQFFLNASLWAIANGAKVNCKGKTPLDYVFQIEGRCLSALAEEVKQSILRNGGKTRVELQKAEQQNTDYWVELEALCLDGHSDKVMPVLNAFVK